MKTPAIGIDLGTSKCCVSVFRNGCVEVISNDRGNRITPCYIAFNEFGRLIGETAKDQVVINPENTIFAAKHLLGRMYEDPVVQSNLKHWPFEVICDGRGRPKLCVKYKGEPKWLYPEEVVAMTLSKMKQVAEKFLGVEVFDAVISIPVDFNSYQRQATRNAGKIAGLNVLGMISEPSLSAYLYGYRRLKMESSDRRHAVRNVLFVDVGAGNVNVSIINSEAGLSTVTAATGNVYPGEDYENRMVAELVTLFKIMYNKDISSDKSAMFLLRAACLKAKEKLSTDVETSVDVGNSLDGQNFNPTFSRAHFEQLNNDLFCAVLDPVKKVLTDAKMDKSEIDDIVLMGGCSRIPKIQQSLSEFFNEKELNLSFCPDETVACGAAIYASSLSTSDDNEEFTGLQDLLVLNATPFNLGIEDTGGRMITLIEKNSTCPTRQSKTFTCLPDDNSSVLFQIFEGENFLTKNNSFLGKITLPGLFASAAEIEVTFDIDASGILRVTALHKLTGIEEKIIIGEGDNYSCGLSEKELEYLISEAAKYQADEIREKSRIEAKEQLQTYCESVKEIVQGLQSSQDNNPQEDLITAVQGCHDVVEWLSNNQSADKQEFEIKLQGLSAVCSLLEMDNKMDA